MPAMTIYLKMGMLEELIKISNMSGLSAGRLATLCISYVLAKVRNGELNVEEIIKATP